MVPVFIDDIIKAVDGTVISKIENSTVDKITTDSREKDGGMFIALKGDNFDGNDFALQYLKNNQSIIVSQNIPPMENKNIIYVENTGCALIKLAGYYRSLFDIPVIGITGSVGKTSTKEMIASILSQHFNTMKTEGNFNNEIGVPLTLFNLQSNHSCAVVEMGMSNLGEMKRLTSAVKPTIAVITNIGSAHIGNLGSRENILKAKLEILEGMNENSLVVLNADDKLLYGLKGKLPFKQVYFGIENKDADIVADDITTSGEKVTFVALDTQFTINAPGRHHILNALAGIAIGKHLGISINKIKNGIMQFKNCGMRQNITKYGDVTIIEDCYNASLDSMKTSIEVLKDISKGRTVAVFGDILEQGDFSFEAHRELGQIVSQNKIDLLLTLGENCKVTTQTASSLGVEAHSFDTHEEVADYMEKHIKAGDTILFKGSRGMKLEKVIHLYMKG
ncbi:MAG: UDP-N-acetylmuramoyl-tripeptide--D-alanyl-D-alanine ligase [Clostridia bacterium]|nr:UDP-N-acetylmuramoyl-tripeptide--D-alanyl-D-alanine ligase [Clostridia bacterium]